jgi:Cys-rich repeat protein
VGAVSPTPRRCNSSADNDCNGQPDNLLDATCACVIGAVVECETHPGLDNIGRCRAGQQVCVAGVDNASSAYTACAGSVGPLAADSCTLLGDDSDCDGEPNGGCACVAGAGNEPCASPTASRCSATGTCVACAANADCSHLADLGVCNAGVCVQCLTDPQCGAGAICNLTTHTCEVATPPSTDAGE